MTKRYTILAALAATALGSAAVLAQGQQQPQQPMRFFVASEPHNGNYGGLAGADAHCQRLAAAAGAGNRTWRA